MKHFIAIVMAILLAATAVVAQDDIKVKGMKNLPNYDMKTWHFGFTLGVSRMGFRVEKADEFMQQHNICGIDADKYTGFHIGPICNLRLNRYMDLRMLFDLSFNQRDLIYYEIKENRKTEQQSIEKHSMQIRSTMLEFPFLIKYKAERITNFSPYIVAGGNFRYDLTGSKNSDDDEAVRLQKIDPCITFGGGADFYLPYFKFSIELRYSLGLMDVVKRDGRAYTDCLKSLKSNAITVSFHFE
ncbi:MAG: PorT family protein [Bacteroidales bacterium]|nr:PorT family protein [Bacteroidales bacterium]